MSISEFVEDYDVAREDIEAVLQFGKRPVNPSFVARLAGRILVS
jgi:uncharacterized protein (DUF433 family)